MCRDFRIIENKHSQMQFPSNQLTIFRLAPILLYLATITFSFQLTLTNRATFPLNAETFFFNRQLLYENSDTFYLVGIYETSTRSLLTIDQTNNNNISNSAPIAIDNLNRNTFFLSLVMDSYLGFIYNVQSESGDIGTLLLINKTNTTQIYKTSLYVSYIAAVFSTRKGTIFGVTVFGQVNMIINAESTNISIIGGPFLVNNWIDYSDIKMTKSINENYLLIFSLQYQLFQLLSVNNTLVNSGSLTIIPQSQTDVYSVCFIRQTSLAVRKNSTISFYSLPDFQLISSESIDLGVSSECYLDSITNQLIFVYQQDNQTIFYAYDMTTASQANTTTVLPTSDLVFTDRKIYTVNSTDPTAVSFSFFNYESCHRNYFYDSANFICYECPAGCNSCNSSQFCYSDCLAGNYFIDDYCCGNSQYYLITNSAKNCYNCPKGCYNCTSSQLCLTCRANNYFIDDYCCGNSQYYLVANSTKKCLNCPSGCYNCTSSQVCLSCRTNNYFINDYCCRNSQYYLINNGAKTCNNCPSNCLNCSSPQFCHACTTGNTLINNFCCGARMYLEINAGIKSCASCPSNCLSCTSPQFCHSCTANNILANNFCCAIGQFVSISGALKSCALCPLGCSNCSNSTFCHSCASGKILTNNFCCNPDQYAQSNGASTTCQNCPIGCATCQGPSLCLTCNTTWMMGIDQLCYNSTEYMPTGQQGNRATIATRQMSDNGFISFFNSFPSLRGMLRAVFGTFGWFDQLYLFQFHERDYGVNMQLLFRQMQTIQKQKWAGADWLIIDRILAIFNSSIGNITKSIDHKAKYSSSFWVKRVINGEGFLVNTLSYFTTIIILTMVFYLIARAAFFILYKQRWSMFFRSFSFWPYLAIILMQGNLLQLIFFACGDLRLAFSLTFSEKVMNMLSWLCFFTLMMFATAMFPMLYSAYSNKARYFSQNMHKPFKNLVVIYLAVQLGFRHLLQGMLHYFLKDGPYYQLQLSLLLTVEILLCASYIFFVLKECFNYKFKLWLSVLQSLLKMALLSFLLLRLKNLDVQQVNNITNKILGYIAAVYIAMIYVNFGVSCLILLKEAAVSLQKRMKRDQKERLKQLAREKEKQKEHLAKQKLRAAKKELYGEMTSNKTTIANEQSLFFRKEDKPKTISANVVKVVRIKRAQQ